MVAVVPSDFEIDQVLVKYVKSRWRWYQSKKWRISYKIDILNGLNGTIMSAKTKDDNVIVSQQEQTVSF